MANPATLDDVCRLLADLRDQLISTRTAAELLGREEMAALLGMGVSTLDRAKAAGQIGPKPFQCSGLKWHKAEVLAWLAHRDPAGELFDVAEWLEIWVVIQTRSKEHRRRGTA